MEVFLTIFLSALLIMLVVISPLPSLPVLIFNYTVNGMINGFITFYIGFIRPYMSLLYWCSSKIYILKNF